MWVVFETVARHGDTCQTQGYVMPKYGKYRLSGCRPPFTHTTVGTAPVHGYLSMYAPMLLSGYCSCALVSNGDVPYCSDEASVMGTTATYVKSQIVKVV